MKIFGPLPSFQDNIGTVNYLRRLLAHYDLCPELLGEVRYPFLDRNFLEFMFAIPREQIVRLGQRRSLMKRALAGIVPIELLNRRRKTFVLTNLKKARGKERYVGRLLRGDRSAHSRLFQGDSRFKSIPGYVAKSSAERRSADRQPEAHTNFGILAMSPHDPRSPDELDVHEPMVPPIIPLGASSTTGAKPGTVALAG